MSEAKEKICQNLKEWGQLGILKGVLDQVINPAKGALRSR